MIFRTIAVSALPHAALCAVVSKAPNLSGRQSQESMVHPGLLHTNDDFERIRKFVDGGAEPWATGWSKLASHADASWQPNAQSIVCRGATDDCDENYASLYRDAHAAYTNAIYWQVTGETANGDAAGAILDAWSGTLTDIQGSSDAMLAAGIYGYQLANAAEILRGYEAWSGLDATIDMLVGIFYPMNHDFLVGHLDNPDDHYWANWDLCNLAAMHATGVLSDNQTMVDEAIDYFKTGAGMGAIENTIFKMFEEEDSGKPLGQNQESGRDQGHATLDFALLGVLAQQSYNQGEDLFSYLDNRILAGAEYVFKYNMGNEVPFTEYSNDQGTFTEISDDSRGKVRPIAELLYAHYNGVKGLNASWTGAYRDMEVEDGDGAEGGGGDYGPDSGGYDQLGFGTILFRLEE